MKLRNKKTGQEGNFIINKDHFECVDLEYVPEYRSLADLIADWEDYTSIEPLVKDEQIRKIIRAWAEENDSTRVVYYSPKNALADSYGNSISFNLIFKELNHGAEYTIAELCGEEDKDEA